MKWDTCEFTKNTTGHIEHVYNGMARSVRNRAKLNVSI